MKNEICQRPAQNWHSKHLKRVKSMKEEKNKVLRSQQLRAKLSKEIAHFPRLLIRRSLVRAQVEEPKLVNEIKPLREIVGAFFIEGL